MIQLLVIKVTRVKFCGFDIRPEVTHKLTFLHCLAQGILSLVRQGVSPTKLHRTEDSYLNKLMSI